MVLAAIYEHHAAVTLCLKRVMVGNHLFKELVDCHFRFSDGRKSGSRGAILKVLSDMRFGPECNGLSLAWPSLLCHRQSGSNPQKCGPVRIGDDSTLEQTMPVLSGLALARATHKKASQRAVGYGHAHWTGRCEILVGRGRSWAIKTSPRMARGH
jgi:hypothetical protein